MPEVLGTFIMFLIFLFFVVLVFKFRREILEWLKDTRPSVNSYDLKDLATLKKYGVEDALDRIVKRQQEASDEKDALRQLKKTKPETGD